MKDIYYVNTNQRKFQRQRFQSKKLLTGKRRLSHKNKGTTSRGQKSPKLGIYT